MKPLTELGSRLCKRLVHREAGTDYSALTNRELWKLCGMLAPEDLTDMERRAVREERDRIIADPRAWVKAWLAMPEGIDRELAWLLFCFIDRVSDVVGDHPAAYAAMIANHELEEAGVEPWYERDRLLLTNALEVAE